MERKFEELIDAVNDAQKQVRAKHSLVGIAILLMLQYSCISATIKRETQGACVNYEANR